MIEQNLFSEPPFKADYVIYGKRIASGPNVNKFLHYLANRAIVSNYKLKKIINECSDYNKCLMLYTTYIGNYRDLCFIFFYDNDIDIAEPIKCPISGKNIKHLVKHNKVKNINVIFSDPLDLSDISDPLYLSDSNLQMYVKHIGQRNMDYFIYMI